MVLPSPLSWYAYHLPTWYLRLITVLSLVGDILMPFMFFVPIRCVRISAYLLQLFMQICIVLTGNYNFVNLLLVTLLLSLLDDKFFFGRSRFFNDKWSDFFGQVANILIHGIIIYTAIVLFNIKVNGLQIDVSTGFTKDQFNMVIKQGVLVATYVGLASLALTIARNVSIAILDSPGYFAKIYNLLGTVFYAALATLIFIFSTVPLSSLHQATNTTISPTLRTMHNRLSKLHIINNYATFTRMPSKNSRLEIILEGSNDIEGPWLEYNFLYKPGNVNHSLPFVAPYSPRIDWQMWWAAQSTYKNEPWLLSLVHRLLLGRPEVLALLDKSHSPFHNKHPKFIRGSLYKYKYTSWNERSQSTWWKREKVGEYFPAFSKDSPALVDYLKARNLLPTQSKEVVNGIWKKWLDSVRFVTSHLEATLLLWSVFTAGCAIITTTKHK